MVNSRKTEKSITKGCPQGSCCGPGFWNIQYNSLLNIQFTHHTKAIAFADDLVITTKAESIPEAENIMNAELSKISAWTRENKLKFKKQKSQVMLMTRRKREENKEVKIYLNNKPLIQVRSIKYLGIIFDHKLTFREHINYVAEKCMKLIFSLSKSAKLNWGLQHAALKTIYTGGIQPLLWRKMAEMESRSELPLICSHQNESLIGNLECINCYQLKEQNKTLILELESARAIISILQEEETILAGRQPTRD